LVVPVDQGNEMPDQPLSAFDQGRDIVGHSTFGHIAIGLVVQQGIDPYLSAEATSGVWIGVEKGPR